MELENGWSMSAEQRRTELRRLAAIKKGIPADWEVVINPRLTTGKHAQLIHAKKRLEVSHRFLVVGWEDYSETFFRRLPRWIAKNQKLSTEKKEVREVKISASVRRKRLAKLKWLVPSGWSVVIKDRLKSTLVQAKYDEKRIEVANDFLGGHWDEAGFVKRMRRWEQARR